MTFKRIFEHTVNRIAVAVVSAAAFVVPVHAQFAALDFIAGTRTEAETESKSDGESMTSLVSAIADDSSIALVRTVGASDVGTYPNTDVEMRTGALSFITDAYRPTQQHISLSTPISAYSGTAPSFWATPEWGRITSGFGYRAKFGRMHRGIDIAMAVGDTVRAPMSGVVKRTGYEARGYGHYIVVGHDDGVETRYAHLSLVMVAAGDRVYSGQPMALSGDSGNSTGPHLHFETRLNGVAVNPVQMYLPFPQAAVATSRSHAAKTASRSTYVVRPGDTIKSVSEKTGVSVTRLCNRNMLSLDEPLTVGRMLKL